MQYFNGKNPSAIVLHGLNCGENQIDHVLATLQQAFPQTALVGGLCQGGIVSESFDSSTTVKPTGNNVFGGIERMVLVFGWA